MKPHLRIAPPAGPMGFFSDIHGNLGALDAVLTQLEDRGARNLYALGDLVFGGDKPLEVWRKLQTTGVHCIRGATDTALVALDAGKFVVESDADRTAADQFKSARQALGDLVLAQIRRLPDRMRIPMLDGNEVVAIHGSPSDPLAAISHDLTDEEVMSLIGDDPADIFVCGATHVPFERRVGEVTIVNVGSVGAGLQAGVAQYAVLSPHPDGTQIEHAWVEF